jgi:hypothetical protein
VLRLILAFVEIALHRRSPADLPASRAFFGAVLVIYVGFELATTRYFGLVKYPELLVAFDTVLELAFIWGVLRAFEHERRFRQAAVAVLGVDTLLNLATVPVLLWQRALHVAKGEPTIPNVVLLIVQIWSIDVSAFVLARALERPYFLTIALMLGYFLLSLSVDATFFATPE